MLLISFPDVLDEMATGGIILAVTASEELSEIYLSTRADCSEAEASSVYRSQEDSAQWSAVNDRRYFTATNTSISVTSAAQQDISLLDRQSSIFQPCLRHYIHQGRSCSNVARVLLTDNSMVLLYAARQSGTVCLLAYVLLTLLRLFVDS